MSDTICIPRERYEYLIKCERLVDMEFEDLFSDSFVKEVRDSEEDYESGRYDRFKYLKDARKHLDSL